MKIMCLNMCGFTQCLEFVEGVLWKAAENDHKCLFTDSS